MGTKRQRYYESTPSSRRSSGTKGPKKAKTRSRTKVYANKKPKKPTTYTSLSARAKKQGAKNRAGVVARTKAAPSTRKLKKAATKTVNARRKAMPKGPKLKGARKKAVKKAVTNMARSGYLNGSKSAMKAGRTVYAIQQVRGRL